eukprot:TRINITY_DN24085_c0_g1_i1.p1 TRINITY_DN24085_c0_g1~~TRINITY_DN24085_c0_g1_i1.p1  ORF type:complete len:168 (+),score=80.92 TRINITY_DN24085_c0_g1_i1:49-552(+)
MIRRPPRSTQSRSSAASDVYKRQLQGGGRTGSSAPSDSQSPKKGPIKSAFAHQIDFSQEKQAPAVSVGAHLQLDSSEMSSEAGAEGQESPPKPAQATREEQQAEKEREVLALQETLSSFEAAASTLQRSIERRKAQINKLETDLESCLLYTSPSPRDRTRSRMPSSA